MTPSPQRRGAIVRIFKASGSRTAKTWVNTYEIVEGAGEGSIITTTGQTIDSLTARLIITKIANAEKLLHSNNIYFVRGTCSTYVADSDPYDPNALVTIDLAGTGTGWQETPESGVDIDVVLNVKRTANHGKSGKLQYRGAVAKGEIQKVGNDWALIPNAPAYERFEDYFDAMADVVAPGSVEWRLALIHGKLVKTVVPAQNGPTGLTVLKRTYIAPFIARDVASLVLGGVSESKSNHKYFDVSPQNKNG